MRPLLPSYLYSPSIVRLHIMDKHSMTWARSGNLSEAWIYHFSSDVCSDPVSLVEVTLKPETRAPCTTHSHIPTAIYKLPLAW